MNFGDTARKLRADEGVLDNGSWGGRVKISVRNGGRVEVGGWHDGFD